MSESKMAHPPQMVRDWIDLAVKYQAASGIGCPECRDGVPSDAVARGHDKHPKNCAGDLMALFAAYNMRTFLIQSAECWYGLVSAPETIEDIG
jgi:hypothetical protein